jgi:hypothetical protein
MRSQEQRLRRRSRLTAECEAPRERAADTSGAPSSSSNGSAQFAEELPDVADEQVWCPHGGEVGAAADFGPVHHRVFELYGAPDRQNAGSQARRRDRLVFNRGSGWNGARGGHMADPAGSLAHPELRPHVAASRVAVR